MSVSFLVTLGSFLVAVVVFLDQTHCSDLPILYCFVQAVSRQRFCDSLIAVNQDTDGGSPLKLQEACNGPGSLHDCVTQVQGSGNYQS